MMILIYKINFKRLEYFSDSTPFLSLDKFIDVKKINKLNKYIESLDLANQKSVSLNTRGKEYSRKIVLTDQINSKKFSFKQFRRSVFDSKYWKKGNNWKKYRELTKFIEELPFFESIGRTTLIFNYPNTPGVEHCDHRFNDIVSEFVWIRTSRKKKFYVKNNGKKYYVDNYCVWFDDHKTHNYTPSDELVFSMRIDGKFKPFFRDYVSKHGNFNKQSYRKVLLNQK
jgi:hypothetical protein